MKTPEEKRAAAERQRKWKASLTPAELAAFRKRDAKNHQKRFAQLSPEEQEAKRRHCREVYARRQAAMSEEDREAQRLKRLSWARQYREAHRAEINEQNRKRFAQLPEARQKEIRARSCEYNRQLRNSRTPEEREQLNAERRQNYDPFTQRLYKMNSTVDPEKLKANRHRVYLRMKDDPVRMAKRMERIHQYNEAHRAEINERQRLRRNGAKAKDEMQLLKLGGLL